MEGFTNVLGSELIKISVLLLYLVIEIMIILYNWLYLTNAAKVSRKIDLEPPTGIDRFVKASILTGFLTVGFILFALFSGF